MKNPIFVPIAQYRHCWQTLSILEVFFLPNEEILTKVTNYKLEPLWWKREGWKQNSVVTILFPSISSLHTKTSIDKRWQNPKAPQNTIVITNRLRDLNTPLHYHVYHVYVSVISFWNRHWLASPSNMQHIAGAPWKLNEFNGTFLSLKEEWSHVNGRKWMKLETIMLSKINQIEKVEYCMSSFIWEI